MTKQRIPGLEFLTIDSATVEFKDNLFGFRLAADLPSSEP
jgi:hypothetical protein